MDQRIPHILATAIIILVWFVNGFFFKVLNLVPRHQEIVGRILGEQHAWIFNKTIGVSEILMVVWILSRINPPLLFSAEEQEIWKQSLQNMGNSFAMMANFPIDPSLN